MCTILVQVVFELKISTFLNYFKVVLLRQADRFYEILYGHILVKTGLLVASLFLANNTGLAVNLLELMLEGVILELIVNNVCMLCSG